MKYMQKKGDETPIPFDEALYDATVYDVFDRNAPAAEPEKSRRKPRVAEPAPEPVPTSDDLDLNFD